MAEGIGVTGLRAVPGVASGLALITVDPGGENSIAVAAGANGLAGDAEVAAAFAQPCDVLVLSAEIPAPALGAALRRARAEGVAVVLNLAPVPEGAAGLLAERPDWLVVNTQEAAALAGQSPEAARPGLRPAPWPEGRPGRGRWMRRRWGGPPRRAWPRPPVAAMSWSRWARQGRYWPGRPGRPRCLGSG